MTCQVDATSLSLAPSGWLLPCRASTRPQVVQIVAMMVVPGLASALVHHLDGQTACSRPNTSCELFSCMLSATGQGDCWGLPLGLFSLQLLLPVLFLAVQCCLQSLALSYLFLPESFQGSNLLFILGKQLQQRQQQQQQRLQQLGRNLGHDPAAASVQHKCHLLSSHCHILLRLHDA